MKTVISYVVDYVSPEHETEAFSTPAEALFAAYEGHRRPSHAFVGNVARDLATREDKRIRVSIDGQPVAYVYRMSFTDWDR